MYDSPQYDMGYDVSNYEGVYPPYGSMEDMDELIRQCHNREMRLILDLIINHTSHKHPWFEESRSSRDNPKRNWYIWRPPKHDSAGNRIPPNNWRAAFGGSVWEWDESTQEYYLHLFCPEQPDLNWENKETRRAIYASAMEFWLEKGIDGFRIDTVNMYSKPTTFTDAPVTDPTSMWQPAANIYCNGPRMHEFLKEMNEIFSRYDAMTVGELPHTPDRQKVLQYVNANNKQLSMVFQFDTVDLGKGKVMRYDTEPFAWSLSDFKKTIENQQSLVAEPEAWSTVFLENHDQARSISRFADDSPQWRVRSGKMLALLLASLSGTLFLYQGQEIGMINVPKSWPIDEYKDVESSNYYRLVAQRTSGSSAELARAMRALQHLARDNARTPMQWNSRKHGGFSNGTPWMRTNDVYKEINVEQQLADSTSVLMFWKRMLQIRKAHRMLLVHGLFVPHESEDTHIFEYVKDWHGEQALVVCNFSGQARQWSVPRSETHTCHLLIRNVEGDLGGADKLQPWEGRLYVFQEKS
ncbi:MAG: glycoside hydrolase family 13 protein [Acidomyces sp. 'richmondensis']|nr:MAG: glycoside hydrolase family 13 protein [Acidomyces sp. 'richmondensis']